ncbi:MULTISPECIES: hypothetical protein [unclassified Streptomyces]|uniref:hypothetical protein n=1 Tax=unclassified Streptomyces TaxID=2593676 RepID=UPI0006AF4E84|nr:MULTISPECIES: hypothetical protein [unclassified Streptomyces]
MSPAPEPTAAPAAPAGRRARPGRHRWVVLLLVLAALFGTGAPAPPSGTSPLPAAAAAPASDPVGETHDQAADTAFPGRTRRHRTGLRPTGPRPRPAARPGHRRNPLSAPVPAPRGDALRCVVMRC